MTTAGVADTGESTLYMYMYMFMCVVSFSQTDCNLDIRGTLLISGWFYWNRKNFKPHKS